MCFCVISTSVTPSMFRATTWTTLPARERKNYGLGWQQASSGWTFLHVLHPYAKVSNVTEIMLHLLLGKHNRSQVNAVLGRVLSLVGPRGETGGFHIGKHQALQGLEFLMRCQNHWLHAQLIIVTSPSSPVVASMWTCFACLRHLSVGKSVAHSFAVTQE